MLPITPAERAAVEAMLQHPTLSPRLRERLEMVKAASLGFEWEVIAAWSGRKPRTVRHWLTRFATGGIAAHGDAPRSGRPPTADLSYHAALDDLADRDPRALGLPFDAWTSARLSAYLTETTGVRIASSWLRTLLIRHRFRCGRLKHTLDHLRDSEAVAICEAAIADAGKTSTRALAERTAWLHLIWLAKYSPHLNEKEREWRYLKRDVRGHLARDLRMFVDEIGSPAKTVKP